MDLIDRAELCKKACRTTCFECMDEDVCGKPWADLPTVDAVEIVRCKDCIFRDKFGYCVAPMGEVGCARVDDDDFCSCGFRKKVEHDA